MGLYSSSSVNPQSELLLEEECQVYSFFIDYWSRSESDLIVIEDEINNVYFMDEDFDQMSEVLGNINEEVIKDYLMAKQNPYSVACEFDASSNYKLVNSEEVKDLFADSGKLFNSNYPDSQGVIAFSGIGFNHEKDQALFYFENITPLLSGSGFYIYMIKTNNVWKVDKLIMLWIG